MSFTLFLIMLVPIICLSSNEQKIKDQRYGIMTKAIWGKVDF